MPSRIILQIICPCPLLLTQVDLFDKIDFFTFMIKIYMQEYFRYHDIGNNRRINLYRSNMTIEILTHCVMFNETSTLYMFKIDNVDVETSTLYSLHIPLELIQPLYLGLPNVWLQMVLNYTPFLVIRHSVPKFGKNYYFLVLISALCQT